MSHLLKTVLRNPLKILIILLVVFLAFWLRAYTHQHRFFKKVLSGKTNHGIGVNRCDIGGPYTPFSINIAPRKTNGIAELLGLIASPDDIVVHADLSYKATLPSDELPIWYEELSNFENIKHLLMNCRILRKVPNGWGANFPHLETLQIQKVANPEYITKEIPNFASLRSLWCSGDTINENAIHDIAASPSLESLVLSDCNLSSQQIAPLSKATHLISLNLNNNNIDHRIWYLFTVLRWG